MKMEILNQTKLQSKNSALDSRISDIATHPSLPNQVLLPASAAAAALSAAQVLLAISDGELQVWDLRVCIPAAQSSETMHCRRTKLRQWWPPPGTHPTQSRIDVRTANHGRQTRLTVVVEGLWSSANPCVAFSCSKTALQTVDLRTRRGVERPTCGTAAELRCSGACSSLFDWDLPANSVQVCASSPSRPFEVFAVKWMLAVVLDVHFCVVPMLMTYLLMTHIQLVVSHLRLLHLFDSRMPQKPLLAWQHGHPEVPHILAQIPTATPHGPCGRVYARGLLIWMLHCRLLLALLLSRWASSPSSPDCRCWACHRSYCP